MQFHRPLPIDHFNKKVPYFVRPSDYSYIVGFNSKTPIIDHKMENKDKIVELLNSIIQLELAGVVRYTHYSLMVFGYNRIPIVSWLREQADESLRHAQEAGEMVTHLGGHPSLKIGKLLESHKHDIKEILLESLKHESTGLDVYKELLQEVEGKSVMLEEYARSHILEEEAHCGEVDKMLRNPGTLESVM